MQIAHQIYPRERPEDNEYSKSPKISHVYSNRFNLYVYSYKYGGTKSEEDN